MPNLKAIAQPLPLAKIAYEALRDSILTGQLIPGEVYNEMALAKELGISRTPVREALLELSSQGLVIYLPRKGVMVKHYTRRDVEEIFELRKAIELAALEKVAKASPPYDLSKLEKTLEEQRKAWKRNDSDAYIHFDRVFHLAFCEMIGNRRFFRILENIRDLIHLMATQALDREGRWEEVINEHGKVILAVQEGNGDLAKEAMDYHLERSKEAVLEQINPEREGGPLSDSGQIPQEKRSAS
ncbi:MAG: GntR family transcriptional regulator [Deltaproteobacteria bacterium]|nr:GntR family transcriptional regulator [Deltaproteobacteria bacterium]